MRKRKNDRSLGKRKRIISRQSAKFGDHTDCRENVTKDSYLSQLHILSVLLG